MGLLWQHLHHGAPAYARNSCASRISESPTIIGERSHCEWGRDAKGTLPQEWYVVMTGFRLKFYMSTKSRTHFKDGEGG